MGLAIKDINITRLATHDAAFGDVIEKIIISIKDTDTNVVTNYPIDEMEIGTDIIIADDVTEGARVTVILKNGKPSNKEQSINHVIGLFVGRETAYVCVKAKNGFKVFVIGSIEHLVGLSTANKVFKTEPHVTCSFGWFPLYAGGVTKYFKSFSAGADFIVYYADKAETTYAGKNNYDEYSDGEALLALPYGVVYANKVLVPDVKQIEATLSYSGLCKNKLINNAVTVLTTEINHRPNATLKLVKGLMNDVFVTVTPETKKECEAFLALKEAQGGILLQNIDFGGVLVLNKEKGN